VSNAGPTPRRPARPGAAAKRCARTRYRHYGLGYGTSGTNTTQTTARNTYAADTSERGVRDRDLDGDGVSDRLESGTVGRDTSGPTTDDAMTRSEEQLRVGTETREAGRARLRQARGHRAPADHRAGLARGGHPRTRADHRRQSWRRLRRPNDLGGGARGPLHAERPVVDTEAVAVERVRLGNETVTDQETVGGEVRKEEVELDKGHNADRDNLR
jgi:hypothetical protein